MASRNRTCSHDGCDRRVNTTKNPSQFCFAHRSRPQRTFVCQTCAQNFQSEWNRKRCDDCLRCIDCGHIVRHAHSNAKHRRCKACAAHATAITSLGKVLRQIRRDLRAIERTPKRAPLQILNCNECGAPFRQRSRRHNTYCSKTCAETRSARDHNHRRRTRRTNAFRSRVFKATIVDRDHWRCQICGDKIDPQLKFPHPQSFSLDHIVPLSLGGTHEPANVQSAHFLCNSTKGNGGVDQLRLIG